MLQETYTALTPLQLQKLKQALQNDEPFYIELEDGYFIGVCVNEGPQFHVLEKHNNWTYGRLKYANT